jgi:hypothetical protein
MSDPRSCRPPNSTLSSLTRVLLSIAVALLAIPVAHGATSNQRPAAGPVRIAHLLEPAPQDVEAVTVQDTRDDEPIAYIGHGGFFDRSGKQIVPTADFVAKAQSWYRKRLLAGLKPDQQAELPAFEKRLREGLDLDGQAGLVAQQRSLDWLIAHSPRTTATGRMQAKLNALKYRLQWKLPRRDDPEELQNLEPFELDPKIEARLKLPEFNPGGGKIFLVTTNSGQAYINECSAADVPIPPSIGDLTPGTGWKSLGFIPTAEQFIVGTPAEVRVFENAKGMCIALPRYTNSAKTTVKLDGVICLSKTTSKVCFWDNQMSGAGFNFPTGTKIPIGVPNLAVNPAGLYQAGGAEIEFGTGGVCTDCHAGENPYIIHPDSNLGGGILMGDLGDPPLNLPTFGPNRYDPIVGASWPQNQLSHSQPLVPGACGACHTSGGSGGRFPHLSSDLPGYCGTILAQAITKTMPLGAPGTLAGTPAITAFQAWCNSAPSSGPSDRGDPHLITTNDVHYDFQAAGEFTALRNSSTGFELQTRQTPVLTSFTPGANAYTGLASCVSLNTAAALRVGRHRISYQPGPGKAGTAEQVMQLRVDGKPVVLPANGLNLGGGNRIAKAAAGGGLDVRANDGTRVIITPIFWTSESYWYLDVEVLNSPAREGTMGAILGSNWLPFAPDGSSFGPMPAGLHARDLLLNKAFADAWRVKNATSLFDYAPGTSTASFTERSWPPPSGSACTTIRHYPWPGKKAPRPVKPMDPETAKKLCSRIQDPAARDDCFFDLTVLGDPAMADAYRLTLKLRTTP